ncbi:four-carbon acid sugar kinase family protein [Leminorella grimontii]|uniref:four-carbon acid sugar kinase family protein n=1 Tax=Leminorella grimontii TaxID=82981 RepID=UPI00321F6207
MQSNWFIAADDLTGAADCAIAFTKVGTPAAVCWGEGNSSAPVVSANIESRALTAAQAASAHREALERFWSPNTLLYKKVDSTLRGQPAAELVATVDFLKEKGAGAFVIVTPAFPGTGRTTEGGAVLVQGQPLESTPLWARDHTYESAHIPTILTEAGLPAEAVSLACVRQGAQELGRLIDEARSKGLAALVCDAASEDDLDIIAAATLPRAQHLFWVGSGGLAAALARQENKATHSLSLNLQAKRGGVLIAVGSLAEASRASAQRLVESGKVRHALIGPDVILADDKSRLDAVTASVLADLASGQDVLVEVALTESPDLTLGTRLMDSLAASLRPAADVVGGLIATGGDTAVALLNHFGVNGLDLIEEVESGIPLGLSIGQVRTPVVTKAGAFGGENTLPRCLERIHALSERQ